MFCIKVDIPEELSTVDDELKANYHNENSVCVFVFNSIDERIQFQYETQGMLKSDRMKVYERIRSSQK